MYRQSYQRGMLTIFFSVGSKPLAYWDTYTQNGYITRFLDHDIKSMVLEIGGTNVSTTYMICPKGKMVLGITMPFLVMVVKNLNKYFSFEVTILDETSTRRRFRVSNFQSTTQVLPLCTVMPIGLSEGWNQIQFNLAEFTRRAYKKQFIEVQKLKINANIRLRRVYFTEKILPEDQLPAEYKLYFPLKQKIKDKKHGQITPEKEITPSAKIVENQKDTKSKSIVTDSKLSMHSIKKPESPEQERVSNVLQVKEDELERALASTAVVDDQVVLEDGVIAEGGIITEGNETVEAAETTEGVATAEDVTTIEAVEIADIAEVTEVAEITEVAAITEVRETTEGTVTPEGSVTAEKVDEPDAGFEEDEEN